MQAKGKTHKTVAIPQARRDCDIWTKGLAEEVLRSSQAESTDVCAICVKKYFNYYSKGLSLRIWKNEPLTTSL